MRLKLLVIVVAALLVGACEEEKVWQSHTKTVVVTNEGLEVGTAQQIQVEEYVYKRFAVGQIIRKGSTLAISNKYAAVYVAAASADELELVFARHYGSGSYAFNVTYKLDSQKCVIPKNHVIGQDLEVFYDGKLNTVLIRPAPIQPTKTK